MAKKGSLRICEAGHRYYKSSDCPTCPICEQERKPEEGFLSLIAAPARRALERAGITTLAQLSKQSETETRFRAGQYTKAPEGAGIRKNVIS